MAFSIPGENGPASDSFLLGSRKTTGPHILGRAAGPKRLNCVENCIYLHFGAGFWGFGSGGLNLELRPVDDAILRGLGEVRKWL